MEEIDTRLVEAERVKASWTPVQDLVVDSLSEHMDNLKVNAVLEFIASLLHLSISILKLFEWVEIILLCFLVTESSRANCVPAEHV